MAASPLWLCEHALWACHGLSSILVGATLALPACPMLGYFSNYGFFFFFFFPQMRLFGLASIPWPWLRAHKGYKAFVA